MWRKCDQTHVVVSFCTKNWMINHSREILSFTCLNALILLECIKIMCFLKNSFRINCLQHTFAINMIMDDQFVAVFKQFQGWSSSDTLLPPKPFDDLLEKLFQAGWLKKIYFNPSICSEKIIFVEKSLKSNKACKNPHHSILVFLEECF